MTAFRSKRPPRRVTPLDPRRVGVVTAYIDENLAEAITLETLARLTAVSRFCFAKRFKAATGVSPYAFVVARRMAHAGLLLQNGCMTVAQAAQAVLCKGMARDLGPRGITVNTVHPGPINTDANPEDGQYGEDLKRLMATPRFGTPADVGAPVTFLASAEAGFVSGTAHHVDNGFTA
jgi:NAD(P)-dependent dehydrogenase (short-subunit alcohol dehydrogenase family)